MRKIIKDPAPVFWTDFIHTHPRLQYKDLDGFLLKAVWFGSKFASI